MKMQGKTSLYFALLILTNFNYTKVAAQVKTQDVVEGSKTLVELIKVFKTPKKNLTANNQGTSSSQQAADSCLIKKTSDACFKNSSGKDLVVSIWRRNNGVYELQPFIMKVLQKKQECWYQLNAGIYRYKIEIDSSGQRSTFSEGELKLQPCENMQREISE